MKRKSSLSVILFLCVAVAAGCATSTNPVQGDRNYLLLNPGVTDLAFLSVKEAEIGEMINQARSARPDGALPPLKMSKGLSLASFDRAQELAFSVNPDLTKQEERDLLFQRVRKFGTVRGSVAQISSHGYPAGAQVVSELMKNSPVDGKTSQPYFMDPEFTVMGLGCTSAGRPSPICVITLAAGFDEP